MPKNTTAYFTKQDRIPTRVNFVNADGTTAKNICTAAADDSRIMEILVTSTDSAARDMVFFLNDGTNDVPIKFCTIGGFQGNINTNPDPFRLVNSNNGFIVGRLFDRDQNYYIALPAGYSLRARCTTAVASGAFAISVLVVIKDF
jgi:hypothetical protein